jgi:hypothetical protein
VPYSVTGVSTYVREDEAIIHVDLSSFAPNWTEPYSWTSLEGGDVEAEDVFTRPGGMRDGVNLGGPRKRSDVTLTCQYSSVVHSNITALENAVGTGGMSCSFTPLDADSNPNGGTVTLTGVLKSVNKPNFNANNSGVVFLGLVMACDTPSAMGAAPAA